MPPVVPPVLRLTSPPPEPPTAPPEALPPPLPLPGRELLAGPLGEAPGVIAWAGVWFCDWVGTACAALSFAPSPPPP